MSEEIPQKTLMGYLAAVPVTQVVEKGLFGGPYIRFFRFLMVSAFVYESGAILGRARHDRLVTLEKIVATPQEPGGFIKFIQETAAKRLEELGREPLSFCDLILYGELERLGLSMTKLSDIKNIKKVGREKMPLGKAEPLIKMYVLEGIGFGSSFPNLTEKMYKNYYESIDMEAWSAWRAAGLDISERPETIAYAEREQEVLAIAAHYTNEYYPELVDPLDFRLT